MPFLKRLHTFCGIEKGKVYTTADGLARDGINRIVRDSRGFLWFATQEGLSKFDGYQFINYTADQGLPQGSVNDVLETRNGDYWIASNDGVTLLNPRGVSQTRVTIAEDNELPLLVNNLRFLILPGVRVRYLASTILSLCARQLPADWERLYGYRPLLLETLVDAQFRGTSYQAAN